MKIEIDPETLTSKERCRVSTGLEALDNPTLSCLEFLRVLHRISNCEFNEFCRKHPGSWI